MDAVIHTTRAIAAEALRLRTWARARLIDNVTANTPNARREAWDIFLRQERCASLLIESLITRPPHYTLPDFAIEQLDLYATSDTRENHLDEHPFNIASDAVHRHPERRHRVADLYRLHHALKRLTTSERVVFEQRIANDPMQRDIRRMIGAVDRPRNNAAVARHYLYLARTPHVALNIRCVNIAITGAHAEWKRNPTNLAAHVRAAAEVRVKTWDVGMLRRRPDHFLKRLQQSPAGTLLSGINLGLASDAALAARTTQYYSGGKVGEHIDYAGDAHNLAGWFRWEEDLVNTWFPKRGRILVIAAGGGREMLCLSHAGYEVDGFECHPALAEAGTDFMRRQNVDATIAVAPPNHAPATGHIYDAAILGWSAFTHIRGRNARINILREIHAQLKEDAPLMLSFFTRTDDRDDVDADRVMRTANVLRRLRGLTPLESGDVVGEVFKHRFTRAEVEDELRAAGWKLMSYGSDPTGHAIAQRA